MEITIYTKTGDLRIQAVAERGGAATCGIQQQSVLSFSFTSFSCVALEVYDYADFCGVRYWVLERYRPRMNARGEWAYSVRMYGAESLSQQALMVNPTDGEDDPLVTLTAPAREHAALIVANMNRLTQTSDWKVGEVDVTPYLSIDYTGKYVSDALAELAEAAETEWWFDGLTLNITRCEFGERISLAYGEGLLGGIEISRAEGARFFTRLFPVGSSRNIDPDVYGHGRLQLPDGAKYVEQDIELGIVEHFEQEAFADIYPRRVGSVSSVRSEERKDDDAEPFTVWYFSDEALPFDPNDYLLGGLVMQVTFQTGELRGRDFEVNYDSAKKEFEIITQWPYDDQEQLPAPPLVPAPGDEYVLWNISMPESYYTAAEQEFREAVDAFMAENRRDISSISVPTDFTVIDRRGLSLQPGQRIRLVSDEYFPSGHHDTRIVSISREIDCPGSMTLTLSDVLAKGRLQRIEENVSQVERLTRQVSSEFPDIIKSWENTPPADTNLYSARKTERSFLNKQLGGTVEGPVALRQGLQVEGRTELADDLRVAGAASTGGPLTVGDYAAGPTGMGGRVSSSGDAELDSLSLRRFLEVPELRYNRVEVTLGDKWSAPGAGIIQAVDAEARLVTLKLEEGEIGAVREGDLCMGIYHSLTAAENATEDYDDGRGNRRFAGFATCYFRITEVLGDRRGQFRYELRPASERYPHPVAPMEAMHFVAYGSKTDPARRTSRYETRTYQRYLRDVDDWEFRAENIAAQFGDLTNLSLWGIDMQGYSAYLDNIYLQGVLQSLDGLFRFDALRKQLLIAAEDGDGMLFSPDRGLVIGKVYDPATGSFAEEYDLAQIDSLKQALDQLNDDTLFDPIEKRQIRIQWETVNGTASTTSLGVAGSYYHALRIAAREEGLQLYLTADGMIYLVRDAQQPDHGLAYLVRDTGSGASALTTAYLALRDYLDAMHLYDDTPTEGFDARRLAELFTVYYDTVDALYKGLSDKAQQTADDAQRKAQEAKDYIDNTLPDEIATINRRLDGVVENWFYPYTPTLQNEPAAGWIAGGDQARHEGDTFTNTQPYVDDTQTPDAGKSWRWVKDGTQYKWTPIADSDAVKALQEAAKAQDTADSKRRIFISQPVPPYDTGDMWAQGPEGDTMRCIRSRKSGTFDAADWDKASKYTDDTRADEAFDKAQKAQGTAQQAVTRLDAWASDEVISPTEKTALKQQRADIAAEYADTVAQGARYGLESAPETTAYKSAYAKADAALAKYTAATPENIPVEDDYADIAAYYTARQNILDKIAQTAKAEAQKGVTNFANPESDPPTGMKEGDTWTPVDENGDPLGYTKTYYEGKGWEITGDNTETIINKGLITAGTIQLGDKNSERPTVKAGMTGAGISDDSVRIWAGSEDTGMDNAPFRVLQSGEVYAENAHIKGDVEADTGHIAGFEIAQGRIGVESSGGPDTDKSTGLSLKNDYVKFSDDEVWIGIGTSVVPSSAGINVPEKIRNVAKNRSTAYGLSIDVQGAYFDNNIAIEISHGRIDGVRHKTLRCTTNSQTVTPSDMDYEIIVDAADVTVKLPPNPQLGQVWRIWKVAAGNCSIVSNDENAANSKKIRWVGVSEGYRIDFPYNNYGVWRVLFDGESYLFN